MGRRSSLLFATSFGTEVPPNELRGDASLRSLQPTCCQRAPAGSSESRLRVTASGTPGTSDTVIGSRAPTVAITQVLPKEHRLSTRLAPTCLVWRTSRWGCLQALPVAPLPRSACAKCFHDTKDSFAILTPWDRLRTRSTFHR